MPDKPTLPAGGIARQEEAAIQRGSASGQPAFGDVRRMSPENGIRPAATAMDENGPGEEGEVFDDLYGNVWVWFNLLGDSA